MDVSDLIVNANLPWFFCAILISFLILRVLRNWRLTHGECQSLLAVKKKLFLGPRQHLSLIECCERRFLLGVAGDNMFVLDAQAQFSAEIFDAVNASELPSQPRSQRKKNREGGSWIQ